MKLLGDVTIKEEPEDYVDCDTSENCFANFTEDEQNNCGVIEEETAESSLNLVIDSVASGANAEVHFNDSTTSLHSSQVTLNHIDIDQQNLAETSLLNSLPVLKVVRNFFCKKYTLINQ